MVMGSIFADASSAIQDAIDKDKESQSSLPDPLSPAAPSAGMGAGGSPLPPAAPVMNQGSVGNAGIPQPQTPAGLEDIQAPQGSLRAQAMGQQAPGYGTVPTAPHTETTDNPLALPFGAYNALNPSIPYVTPAIDATKGILGQAVQNTVGAFIPPVAGPGGMPVQNPIAQPIGSATASLIPSRALDLGLAAAPFLGEGVDALRGGMTSARTGLEDVATRGLEPRPIAPDMAPPTPLTPPPAGGAAIPPGPRDPYNLFDAVGAEKAAARADPLKPVEPIPANPLEGLIRAPNEPTSPYYGPGKPSPSELFPPAPAPIDPIAAAQVDVPRGYRPTWPSGGPDANPVNDAYRASLQQQGVQPRIQPPESLAPPVLPVATPDAPPPAISAPDIVTIREMSKVTGLGVTNLRNGDPEALIQEALDRAVRNRDLTGNSPGSTQAWNREVTRLQRAQDNFFPKPEMPAQGAAPIPAEPTPLSENFHTDVTNRANAAVDAAKGSTPTPSGVSALSEPVFNPDGTPSDVINRGGLPQRTLENPSYTDAGKAQRAGEVPAPTRAQTFSDAQTALYDSINQKVAQQEQGLGRSLTDTERLRIAESERVASGIKPPEITASFLDYANLPRSMMAGADMSYALRQMALLVPTHLPEAIKSLGQGARAVFDPEHAALIEDAIKNSPFAALKDENRFGRLYQAPTGNAGTLLTREENYGAMPALEKLGPAGRFVRGLYEPLERGNTTMINKFRSDVADNFINTTMRNNGVESVNAVTPKMAKDIGTYNNFINRATGRGNLGSIEKAAVPLGQVFFSLRSAIAKPETLGYLLRQPGSPVWNQVAKDFAGFLGAGAATLALADQTGLKVGLDPRSSDFGKIRAGDNHIDLWAGWQPMVRAIYQEAQGLRGENNRVTSSGAGYHVGGLQVAGDFLRNKLSPPAGAAVDLGGPSIGIDRPPYRQAPGFNTSTLTNYLAPLWIQDTAQALLHDGVQGAAVAGPLSFFGVGTQSYSPPRGEVRSDVLAGGKAALPASIDQKSIPAFDLLPKERAAVDKSGQSIRPDVYQDAQDSRTDPQKARDTVLQQASTIQNAQLTSLSDDLFNGVKDPVQVEAERKQANADAKWRRDNAPDVPYDGPETEKGPANQLLFGYFNISKNIPALPDGKPNYDGIKQAQTAYMSALSKDYPQIAERIANQLNGPAESTHQLNKVHDEAQPLMDKYFSEITNPKTRTAERIAHPEEDAQLVLLGIEHEPASIEAARLLQKLAPNLKLAPR